MDVTIQTNEGMKTAKTDPVPSPVHEAETYVPRRVSLADINGPVGEFLSQTLFLLAPSVYNAGNWKGKLVGEVTSNQSSFLCCGRAIGLAQVERKIMSPNPPAVRVQWLIVDVDGGGTKQDAYEILKTMRVWARSMGAEMILPSQDFTNVPVGKTKDIFKAKDRIEHVIPALDN